MADVRLLSSVVWRGGGGRRTDDRGLTTEDGGRTVDRERVRLALERENIESRPLWKPMHLQPVFAGCRFYGGEVSERLFRDGLCLPSGSALTAEEHGRVCDVVRREFRR